MRRLEHLLTSVSSALIAFATLAVAALFRSGPRADGAGVVEPVDVPTTGRSRRVRRMTAVPLVAVLAVGATAFAAGAGTPSAAEPVAVGDQIPHRTAAEAAPATPVSVTTTPPTTAPPTTQAPTTTAPPTTAAPETTPPAPVQVSGACGGNLPPCCVMMRESGGNISVVNPSSGAAGKWQFMPSTWANHRGYPTASVAPEWVQDEKAAQLWAGGAGAGHWGGGCW